MFVDYFASKNIPTVPTSFDGRSDYGPFIAEGVDIPAGGLFTGAEGVKTADQAKLFGGTAGVAYDINYHAKGDTYDNLNFTAFLVNAKVPIALFTRLVIVLLTSKLRLQRMQCLPLSSQPLLWMPNRRLPVPPSRSLVPLCRCKQLPTTTSLLRANISAPVT